MNQIWTNWGERFGVYGENTQINTHIHVYTFWKNPSNVVSGWGGGKRIGVHFTIPGLKDVRAARIPRFLLRKFARNNSSFLPAGITTDELWVDDKAAVLRACYIEKAVAWFHDWQLRKHGPRQWYHICTHLYLHSSQSQRRC